jgi:hypothetical protein
MKDVDGAIYAVAFNPDATNVVSGGFSGNLMIHNAETGERLKHIVPVPMAATQVAQQ